MKYNRFCRDIPAVLLIGILLMLAGCSDNRSANSLIPPPTPISLQLAWVHDYSSTPFYAADQNGHFAAQNLDVQFLEGGFEDGLFVDAVDKVVDGTATFGITDGYNLILARSQGKPVVAIAAILQRSPSAIISLQSSHIARPQDLIGKRVAITVGRNSMTWTYDTMLASQGITLDQIEAVPRTTYGIDPLINGEVDAMTGWLINEGIQVKEAGYKANFIVMSDYGADTFPVILFTTEQMIAEQPQTVERFLRALLAGMQDTLGRPNQAAELVLHYNDTLDLDKQRRRLIAALPFLKPANSKPLLMQADVWQETAQILIDQGALDKPIDVGSAYTTVFLDEIYGQ